MPAPSAFRRRRSPPLRTRTLRLLPTSAVPPLISNPHRRCDCECRRSEKIGIAVIAVGNRIPHGLRNPRRYRARSSSDFRCSFARGMSGALQRIGCAFRHRCRLVGDLSCGPPDRIAALCAPILYFLFANGFPADGVKRKASAGPFNYRYAVARRSGPRLLVAGSCPCFSDDPFKRRAVKSAGREKSPRKLPFL